MQLRDTVFLTDQAMKELKDELDYLRITRRREVADMLRESRDNDHTSDSDAPHDPARDEQAFVEGRILEIEQLLAHARRIDGDEGRRTGKVALGSTVHVEDTRGRKRTYQIVDSFETDPTNGKVSDESPVGSALLGAALGDTVEVAAPAGTQKLTVRKIA